MKKADKQEMTTVQEESQLEVIKDIALQHRSAPLILTALTKIGKAIAAEGIGKTRKNASQGYSFRGVDEVMNAFAPLFAEQGVLILPKYTNRQCLERSSKNGATIFNVTIEGEFTFIHEDGSSITIGPLVGEAMDSADKATNKAMAVAFKYALFQTFCVPLEGVTGGDADEVTHEVVASKPERIKQVTYETPSPQNIAFLKKAFEKCQNVTELRETANVLWSKFPELRDEIKAKFDIQKQALSSKQHPDEPIPENEALAA